MRKDSSDSSSSKSPRNNIAVSFGSGSSNVDVSYNKPDSSQAFGSPTGSAAAELFGNNGDDNPFGPPTQFTVDFDVNTKQAEGDNPFGSPE